MEVLFMLYVPVENHILEASRQVEGMCYLCPNPSKVSLISNKKVHGFPAFRSFSTLNPREDALPVDDALVREVWRAVKPTIRGMAVSPDQRAWRDPVTNGLLEGSTGKHALFPVDLAEQHGNRKAQTPVFGVR